MWGLWTAPLTLTCAGILFILPSLIFGVCVGIGSIIETMDFVWILILTIVLSFVNVDRIHSLFDPILSEWILSGLSMMSFFIAVVISCIFSPITIFFAILLYWITGMEAYYTIWTDWIEDPWVVKG